MPHATVTVELKRGVTLGNYELLVKIGQGGMASVWVARERVEGHEPRLVAVKTMHPQLSTDPKFRSMFLDEVGLVRSIDHDNVVRLYSTAEDQGLLYMGMEWIEGDSLRSVINEAKKRRPIPPEIAVRIISDAAAGLHAAHELTGWDGELRGVVHCDVSPHNILCGIDGKVKLVDFGVANAMSQFDETDEVRGKFGYMSPEQARGDAIDRRSDVFSLGIVLFELTTGDRLFLGRDNSHTLDLVKWGKLPKPTEVIPDYPRALESIVMKALHRDIDERYQTAEDLRDALERYLVEERTLVAKAGVAGLVKRVLGERIERIRHAVRTALEEIDGAAPSEGILPVDPVLTRAELEELSLVAAEEVSLSRIEATPVETTGVAELPPSEQEPLEKRPASTPPPTSTPPPASNPPPASTPPPPIAPVATQAEAAPSPTRSRFLPVLFGIIAALATVVAIVAYQRLRGDEPPETARTSPGGAEQPRESPPPVAPGEQPVSVDSLPFGDDSIPVGVESLPVDDGTEEAAKEKNDEPRPTSRKSSSKPKVKLTEEKPPAAKKPLNRSAMLAALGSAAGSASGCKRSGGPSGRGRASVTFSPNGRVTGVSLSGKFAGTSVGQCVVGVFRSARVPPFSGTAVTVGRGFVVPD